MTPLRVSTLGLVLLAAACNPVDTVVVDVPEGSNVMPEGAPCADNTNCLPGQFCRKDSCAAALGQCAQRPVICSDEGRVECGCDGVSYWNSCLRENAGVAAARENGPCRNPKACDTSTPCPEGASCARLVFPNECGRTIPGACWVVPEASCSGPAPTFFPCAGGQQCVTACAAIRSEQPMAERPRGSGPCP